jgi:hypothetical protein
MRESIMRATAWIGSAVLMTALTGCGKEVGSSAVQNVNTSTTDAYALGWMGGRARPVASVVQVPDPDRAGTTIATGGMVIVSTHADSPLTRAGAAPMDVIVRIGESWVPNKEDPALDLYRLIESEVSAGLEHVRLSVLRGGVMNTILVENTREPLEVGGPGGSERLRDAGRAGLDRLAAWEGEEAPGDDRSIGATALAGLAFLAGGPEAHSTRVDRCAERVQAAMAHRDQPMSAWDAAWATLFLAELAGPLPIEMPTFEMASGGTPVMIGGEVPEGVVIGQPTVITSGELPEGFELPEGATSGTMTFTTTEGDTPDLDELMESGSVRVMAIGPGMSGAPAAVPTVETEEVDGPLWTPEQLEVLTGPDTIARLASLTEAVDRLVALQGESGGWDGPVESIGYSDRTLVTNQVLMALGAAERAGVAVDNAVIRRGLAYVRSHTNDGHVFAVEEPGFDRRREAGRSSGAAAALVSLNCIEGDEFYTDLMEYSGEHAKTVAVSTSGVPLHAFNTAVLRRHLGRGPWATWFEEFRHLLVGLQDPDGSFAALPAVDPDAPAALFDTDPTSRTALWSLCALMASDHTPILCATAENPLQTGMDSKGARVTGGAAAIPSGSMQLDEAQIMKMLEGADLPDSVREAIEKGNIQRSTDG